jgi:hypothetical protein
MNEPKLVIVYLEKLNEAFALASENLKPITGGMVMRMLQAAIAGPYEPQEKPQEKPQEAKDENGKSE